MSKKKNQHIKLKNGKIIYASEQLTVALQMFYFAHYADLAMQLVGNSKFKNSVVNNVTNILESLGLSWNDIPEEISNWGVVLDSINEKKEGIEHVETATKTDTGDGTASDLQSH